MHSWISLIILNSNPWFRTGIKYWPQTGWSITTVNLSLTWLLWFISMVKLEWLAWWNDWVNVSMCQCVWSVFSVYKVKKSVFQYLSQTTFGMCDNVYLLLMHVNQCHYLSKAILWTQCCKYSVWRVSGFIPIISSSCNTTTNVTLFKWKTHL